MTANVQEAWVINDSIGGVLWWDGAAFTMNLAHALRFSRKADAERGARAFGLERFHVTSRTWTPAGVL